mgnify:CR=1 FL=1
MRVCSHAFSVIWSNRSKKRGWVGWGEGRSTLGCKVEIWTCFTWIFRQRVVSILWVGYPRIGSTREKVVPNPLPPLPPSLPIPSPYNFRYSVCKQETRQVYPYGCTYLQERVIPIPVSRGYMSVNASVLIWGDSVESWLDQGHGAPFPIPPSTINLIYVNKPCMVLQ